MTAVAVAIPVLGRPDRVQPVLASIRASERILKLRPFFVCSPGDNEEHAAVVASGADLHVMPDPAGPGDYARKINAAFRLTDEPWFFAGADDLHFHPGWADEAVEVGMVQEVGVVGTNDLGNPAVMAGKHATHPLFERGYVLGCGVIDQPGAVYCEAYDHQFVDTEACETAQARECFAYAERSIVEHLHPFWNKSKMDDTYRKGMAQSTADRTLFNERRRLWA